MVKATKTIRQSLGYKPAHTTWYAATNDLFNQVAAFYFEMIQAHLNALDFYNKDALTALEKLTYTTQSNPTPVMPLSTIGVDIPAMFRHAAINAALGYLRQEFPQLEWGLPSLWTHNYFVAKVGGISWETFKRSMEGQQGK